jgi:hypothetical protein
VIFVIYRNGRSHKETYVALNPKAMKTFLGKKTFRRKLRIFSKTANMIELTQQQLHSILQENLKTEWSHKPGTPPARKTYLARKGSRIMRAIHYSIRMQLVVEDLTAPSSSKVNTQEIQRAKSLCVPPLSKYNEYVQKWGIPYSSDGTRHILFEKNNYLINVTFDVGQSLYFAQSAKGKITTCSINENFKGARSKDVVYYLLNDNAVKKLSANFSRWKSQFKKFCVLKKTLIEKDKIFTLNYSFRADNKENIVSMPPIIIATMLEAMTSTKWEVIPQQTIAWIRYATWSKGHCIHATYDVIGKGLWLNADCHLKKMDHYGKYRDKKE